MAIHNEVPSNGIGDLHYSIVCKVFLPIFCMVLQSFLLGKHRILESPVPFPAQGRTVECLWAQLAYRAKAQKVQITGRNGYDKFLCLGSNALSPVGWYDEVRVGESRLPDAKVNGSRFWVLQSLLFP